MIFERLASMIARAVVGFVSDAGSRQRVQASIYEGEEIDDLERFQQYGFSSVPKVGAEAVVLSAGGERDGALVIVVDDRRFRLRAQLEGEVALYDDLGQTVRLTRTGIVIESATEVIVESPSTVIGTSGFVPDKLLPTPLSPFDGVVTGRGVDPTTSLTYAALGNASNKVFAEK